MTLRQQQKSLDNKAAFQGSWDGFWASFLHNRSRDKHVFTMTFDRGMLTNADLADVKAKMGISVDYDKIAPLFDNPAKP